MLVPLGFFILIGLLCVFKPAFVAKCLISMDWQSRNKELDEISKSYVPSRVNPIFVRLIGIVFFIVGFFYIIKILIYHNKAGEPDGKNAAFFVGIWAHEGFSAR